MLFEFPKGMKEEKNRFRLCPECSNVADFGDDILYCILCGTKLIGECPKCHNPIYQPHARYCFYCGENFLQLIEKKVDGN